MTATAPAAMVGHVIAAIRVDGYGHVEAFEDLHDLCDANEYLIDALAAAVESGAIADPGDDLDTEIDIASAVADRVSALLPLPPATGAHYRLELAVRGGVDPNLATVRADSDAAYQIDCPYGPDACGVDYGADTPADLLAMVEAHIAEAHR